LGLLTANSYRPNGQP